MDLPTVLLNKILGIINKFLWKDKRAWVCSLILELWLENEGLAIPNIKKSYLAAMLVACLVWWRFRPYSDILVLEQGESEQSLADWLVVSKGSGLELKGVNQMARKLEKAWAQHQEGLIPSESLLMAIAEHTEFFWLKHNIDFKLWQRSGISKFRDLFVRGHLVT